MINELSGLEREQIVDKTNELVKALNKATDRLDSAAQALEKISPNMGLYDTYVVLQELKQALQED